MLWTASIILLVLWVLGLSSGARMGAWIHLFLALALVALALAVVASAARRLEPRG